LWRIIIGPPFLRASATSRIASPAVLPSAQLKADANKADDTSPFAILLNEVVAKSAVPQKRTQNKDSQGSGENSENDSGSKASGTDAASQTVSQTEATPPKSDKGSDKSAKTNGDKRGGDSAGGPSAQVNQQPGVQIPAPAQLSASQTSLILAANAGGAAAGNAGDEDVSTDPADTAGTVAGQNNTQTPTQSTRTGSGINNTPTAGQAPIPQGINSPAGQNSGTQAQAPAPVPNIPLPDGAHAPPVQPARPPAQPPANAQNIVQTNPLQPAPVQPPLTQNQPADTDQNSVQADAPPQQAATPKGQNPQTSVAQNTVQSDADQPPAVQARGPQVQTSATQNTVQSSAAPAPSVQPAKTDKSNDKDAKNAAGKSGSGSAADATAASQVQPPVQPDASLIANATAVTPADDDASQDQPDVEAAGAVTGASNGPAKAQAPQNAQGAPDIKNLQAALAARQANTPQGPSQAAASQTGARGDNAKTQDSGAKQLQPQQGQQDANLSIKPWQAKPQTGDGSANANSGQTNTASPDDVKQAASPAPQAAATGNMPMLKPADAGNSNLPVIPGAAPQNQPGQANTALTQNVQVSTSGPNVPALAVEIAARSQSGAKQFDIRLDPPELGRVEIRLSIDATGKASAHVSADQPQTLDLLQKDAPTLTRALRDAGLNVAQNGLNFSLRQQQGDAGASGNQNRGGNGRSFTLAAVSNIDATPAGATYRGPADGRLDIRV
jgi:flagellar hook-length control protein FliK